MKNFWGGQNIFPELGKSLDLSFIYFNSSILNMKFFWCQIDGTFKSLVLPIGADAHLEIVR